MHRFLRSGLAGVGVVAIALALGACGADQNPTLDAQPTTRPSDGVTTSSTLAPNVKVFVVTVTGNKVDGGPQVDEVKVGDPVRIEVTSDTANEVHVHGYDLSGTLAPGVTTRIDLVADKAGQWEIELHDGNVLLATLRVDP
ncbi:MAG: hypothetical protein HYR89_03905 [Actinobacteria bacterium]|nr:hypothetical protein [Actinomycetota bacterium]